MSSSINIERKIYNLSERAYLLDCGKCERRVIVDICSGSGECITCKKGVCNECGGIIYCDRCAEMYCDECEKDMFEEGDEYCSKCEEKQQNEN